MCVCVCSDHLHLHSLKLPTPLFQPANKLPAFVWCADKSLEISVSQICLAYTGQFFHPFKIPTGFIPETGSPEPWYSACPQQDSRVKIDLSTFKPWMTGSDANQTRYWASPATGKPAGTHSSKQSFVSSLVSTTESHKGHMWKMCLSV